MKISNPKYKCVHCNGQIIATGDTYKCNDCSYAYIEINSIPLFLEDGKKFANENYASIWTHKNRTYSYLGQNEEYSFLQTKREESFTQLRNGFESNMVVYDSLLKDLEEFIIPELLVNANYSTYQNEPLKGKELNYLMRDWGGATESEEEINNILEVLERLLEKHSKKNNSIFFAGSGTGRFAYELASQFKEVYCTDLSYRMIHFFKSMLEGKTIDFYQINGFSNIYNTKDVTKKVSSYDRWKKEHSNISYFISDIQNIPIISDSMDVFASVYFLDVLNIENYIREINRVLKKDGVYINIGPIGYSEGNFVHNLMPSEIKSVFEKNGFEIEHEEFITTTYMASDVEMSYSVHKNWVFIARKKENTNKEYTIALETVLELHEKIFAERKSEISSQGETVFYNRLYNQYGDNYENADLIIEILYLLDDAISVQSLIDRLENELGVILSFEELHPILMDFLSNKSIRIKQP